jgi:hypothetical protein
VGKVITGAEIKQELSSDPESFAFDLVMVDECQDWPRSEIEIIRACYEHGKIVVADGIDQLVRGPRAFWSQGIAMDKQRVWKLDRALRLKRNIAVFTNRLAIDLGLREWKVFPNDEVHGGRVIVVDGSIFELPEIHKQLLKESQAEGNCLVDVLYCVAPSLGVLPTDATESRVSRLLRENDIPCWDGIRRDIRTDIPRSLDEVRVVQYESCRGLEGWTVFCLRADELFRLKMQQSAPEMGEVGAKLDEPGHLVAARWLMIAATRAMDTLVIEIGDESDELRRALRKIADDMPDSINWVRSRPN